MAKAKTSEPVSLPDELKPKRIISAKQAAEMYGLSLPHFRRLYRAKKVPAPVQIGLRKYGWQAVTILDDIAAKAVALPKAA